LKWTQWDRWIIDDSEVTLGGVFDFHCYKQKVDK
jgi:hypothetical protein